jgi:hypothetical protein
VGPVTIEAAPVEPVGPSAPVAPVFNDVPCNPCGPVAPVLPVVPWDPWGPVGPVPPKGGAFERSPVVELIYTTLSETPLGMFLKFTLLEAIVSEETLPKVLLPTVDATNAESLGIKPNDIYIFSYIILIYNYILNIII